MATEASIINNALRLLGEPVSPTLDLNRPKIRQIRNAWDDVLRSWFEDHDWVFATTEVQLSGVSALPGWTYAFNSPASLYKLIRLSATTDPRDPGIPYEARAGLFLTNYEVTYCKYVDGTYLAQYGGWPQKFANAFSALLAQDVHPSTDETDMTVQRILMAVRNRTRDAKTADEQFKPLRFVPEGNWSRARRHGIGRRYE